MSDFETPEWARGATSTAFNPTVKNPAPIAAEPSYLRVACGCRVLSPEEQLAHDNSEISRLLRSVTNPERTHLQYLASLLRIPRWLEGSWASDELIAGIGVRAIAEGWRHWRDGKPAEFLSFAQMEQLIAERIEELGLDRALIEAHANSCSEPGRELWRLPWEVQLNHFRKVK